MAETRHCPRCGTAFAEESPESVCPACLLREGLVGSGAQPPDPDTSSLTVEPPPRAEASPTRIGPYKILETLGEGGMGIVYLAEQHAPIRRRVALKVMKLDMATREVVARFETEQQVLALMDHPHIAKVFDAGLSDDGRPYFAMEHVPGIPITDYCDRHRLNNGARLKLFRDVCGAIQHAHQKGLIHRDIKPSNVLVMVQDGKPVPKVIDFGVAKAINQRLSEKTFFTRHGVLLGTPEYMSPEQAEMGELNVDTTTDIYSLGVLLYELLVGALPFDRKVLREAAYAEVQRIIREEEPARPSTRVSSTGPEANEVAAQRRTDPRSLQRQVCGDLDWITLKALEKDRTRRYPSASEFAADIGRYLSNDPVQARPASTAYRLSKLARRHRGAVTAAAVVFVILVGSAVVSSWLYVAAEHARREEVRQRETAEWKSYVANVRSAAASLELGAATQAAVRLASVPEALRGWEWRYLAQQADSSLAVLAVGPDPVLGVTFIDDGARVVSHTAETVDVWDIASRQRIDSWSLELAGRGSIVALSPEGSRLLVAARRAGWQDPWRRFDRVPDQGGALGWAAAAGTTTRASVFARSNRVNVAVLEAIAGELDHAAFSQNGERVLTLATRLEPNHEPRWIAPPKGISRAQMMAEMAGGPGFPLTTVQLWDARTGTLLASTQAFLPFQNGVPVCTFVAVGPLGRYFAVDSMDGVRIHDDAGSVVARLPSLPRGGICNIQFSSDGLLLLLGSPGRGEVWDWNAGRKTLGEVRSVGPLGVVAFGPEDKSVVSGYGTRARFLPIALPGRGAARTFFGHTREITGVSLSPEGDILATSSGDGTVRLWRLAGGAFREVGRYGTPGGTSSLEFSEEGGRVFAAGVVARDRGLDAAGGTSTLAEVALDGGLDRPFVSERPDGRSRFSGGALAVASDGTAVATGGNSQDEIIVWDTTRRSATSVLAGHEGRVLDLDYGPDSTSLVSASEDGTVRIWDTETGQVLGVLTGHETAVRAVAVSPDGARAVSGSDEGVLIIWDLASGDPVRTLRGHAGGVTAVRFAPDGLSVVSAGRDHTVRIWGVGATDHVRVLSGHTGPVGALALDPSGSRIASASLEFLPTAISGRGSEVRVWDFDSGDELLVLLTDDEPISSLAFSPSGETLAFLSLGGLVGVWEAAP